MDDPEKTCGNCGNLIRHFMKYESHLKSVGDGHCTVPRMAKFRRVDQAACPHWQPRADDAQERRTDIFATLGSMARNLEDIARILGEERTEEEQTES